jgi:hypothetical protein
MERQRSHESRPMKVLWELNVIAISSEIRTMDQNGTSANHREAS